MFISEEYVIRRRNERNGSAKGGKAADWGLPESGMRIEQEKKFRPPHLRDENKEFVGFASSLSDSVFLSSFSA